MTRTSRLDFGSGQDADITYSWNTKRKLFSLAEVCTLPSAITVTSSTDLFVYLAVHGIFNISLQHHFSKQSIFLLFFFFTVLDSYPYIATGKTRLFTSLLLVCVVTSLSFQIFINHDIAILHNANRPLISPPHSAPTSIFEPRKMKLSTISV